MRALPFTRVLVANRGEIAVRVFRTLRARGITAIAVFTPADDGARHVREADLALPVPSYLDAEAIVAVARAAGAEAIHPGYGYLSESPVLARACVDAGIVWVGPGTRALQLMGDKVAAKAHVEALGVPVVPGVAEQPSSSADGVDRNRALEDRAHGVGYPLIVKPSAGGGGKGMGVVRAAVDLPEALTTARRVALAAFGDDTLLLERLVPRPRHIEAQVIGDADGNVELLGLRECSLQRRHQKVIEEAPAPFPVGSTRELLGVAAVRIARSVDYVGVGTIEFLVSGANPGEWYFLEMNTRLQVEHPVTEAVTGVDLVEAQLRVAAGESLWLRTDVPERGHAVEARVYAERPDRGFLPSTGRLLEVIEPSGVRVDSGISAGQTVSADHDPMLLKVVAFADDRADALRMLDAALSRTVLLGVHTNIAYLRQVIATPEVRDGVADTAFLDTFQAASTPAPDGDVLAAAALALWHAVDDGGAGLSSPWAERSGWRLGEPAPRVMRLEVEGEPLLVGVPEGPTPGVRTAVDGDVAWVWRDGTTWALRRVTREELVERSRRERRDTASDGATDPQVRSPMPGTVVALPSPDGGDVGAGAVVAVIEAMKMEHAVLAPVAGRLELMVREGQTLGADQVVAVLHPAG